ncbi:EAL domain-containing protein [Acidocella aminolytica]|nr:EAL domain-containing protein [Acidocella aminolytica]SHF52076.1 PAS domain S-box-containing protein/diguanylate cyclase (GGDEF) domain-containing protein [Acidocella aminolytica 101 = DSM 11237]
MFLELIKAAAFLLALSMLQGLIARLLRPRFRRLSEAASGLVFGVICIFGMMDPIHFLPGIFFDPRSVVLSMAGLFGGTLAAAIAALVAGSYRVWLGGSGAPIGVSTIIVSTLFGLLFRYANKKRLVAINVVSLLVFGLLLHVVEVLMFTQLPDITALQVMKKLALPLLLTFTPATAILGLMLKDADQRLKTEEDLQASETRLSLHLQNTPLAGVTWDPDFYCVQWNRAAERIFGYTREEALGQRATDLIVPEWLKPQTDNVFRSLLVQKDGQRNTTENVTKDGRVIICDWYSTPIIDSRGKTLGVISLADDITELKQATRELEFKNLMLTTQQESSVDGILSVDRENKIISINRRMLEIWSLPGDLRDLVEVEQLLKSATTKVANPAAFLSRVNYLYQHYEEISNDEVTMLDGRTLECHSSPMFGNNHEYYGRLWMFRDITARKRSEEIIWKQANFDSLTGLANRQLLHDRLEQEIQKAHRVGTKVALLYIDLDEFKHVNDTLGHDVGDHLLIDAAKRINKYIREADTVARQGGDEFIIVMGDLTDVDDISRTADEILEQLSLPFHLGAEKAYVSASMGITFYPDDALRAEDLMRNADQAMYAAKARGRNCYQYFTPSMQEHAVTRMQLVRDMKSAINPANSGQFQLYYQPIIDLRDGSVTKAEALIRWYHPERGFIPLNEFIKLAEETRIIIDIGDWVFREATLQCANWRDRFGDDFQISINTSPVQYHSEHFRVSRWLDYMHTINLPGKAVVVEITEGLLMETTGKVTSELLEFRDAGVQVSLDDFGTGYSSLAYLKKFDIDYLKIDQSFVRELENGSDDMALCEAIIVMAHKLGIKVVAEGVETEEQKRLLMAASCDYAQGYHFARPLPARDFEALLTRRLVGV